MDAQPLVRNQTAPAVNPLQIYRDFSKSGFTLAKSWKDYQIFISTSKKKWSWL